MWESDIHPPEAWGEPVVPEQPLTNLSLLDTGGEVWEDDLYGPDAWVSGVERLNSQQTSANLPSAQAEEAVETHAEAFWPNIERYISSRSGSKPVVTCVICQASDLVIPGLQERDTDETLEELEVLPCGHVVGADCFGEWEAVAAKPVKCPVCNAVVE